MKSQKVLELYITLVTLGVSDLERSIHWDRLQFPARR